MKTKLLLIVAITLIIIDALLGYLFISKSLTPKITVSNASNFYTLSFHETTLFNRYLADWGIFSKELDPQYGESQKIKTVIFETVDSPQRQQLTYDKQNNLLHSGGSYLKANDIFLVRLQINHTIANANDVSQQQLNEYILNDVIRVLYQSSHHTLTIDQFSNDMTHILNDFNSHPAQNPFIIKIKSQS
ncbi:MAG TPA: hypothetical protein VG935_03830 [Patescibacteria group bacterium]|nr:hypothetical protein [Patescibacteria group bacterium]